MESPITSPAPGRVDRILVAPGTQVLPGTPLLTLAPLQGSPAAPHGRGTEQRGAPQS